MRFRIPRNILRAAIAANVFLATSAAGFSSIPGNRNNSYQPIGLVDVAEANGLTTYGRFDKLPNFVLHSPTSMNTVDTVSVQTPSDADHVPRSAKSDEMMSCEIEQDFEACWMTCPEERPDDSRTHAVSTVEDQIQSDYIERQQMITWLKSGVDLLKRGVEIGRDLALEAPFDSGLAISPYIAQTNKNATHSNIAKETGNIFVYIIEQVDAPDQSEFENNFEPTTEPETTIATGPNLFQSGIQDLLTEIQSSIESKNLGCGYDPYECCFPNEIAESSVAQSQAPVINTRIVSEDDFIPFPLNLQHEQLHAALPDADADGIGHCAVPLHSAPRIDSLRTRDITLKNDSWQPNWHSTKSLVESWIEPNWNIRKWEFVTRAENTPAISQLGNFYRSPNFRWDAVYGHVNAPMLSEIPIDPSLTLAQDLYPQPNWYGALSNDSATETIPESIIDKELQNTTTVEVALIEPKRNSDKLISWTQNAWDASMRTINARWEDSARLLKKLTFDSKKLLAGQLKQFGSLLLRSADSLEGNIGFAQRNDREIKENR